MSRLRCFVLSLLCLAGCSLPGTIRPVLKLGLIAPFEGWYRLRGYDALWGMRLAIQEVNNRGGVAGHLVELVVLDDHLDPDRAVQRARELVADPSVMGVVGCLSPSTAEAARGVCSAAALPLITPASVEANGDGVFVVAPAPDALARAVIGHIQMSSASDQPDGADALVLLYDGEGGAWSRALKAEASGAIQVELDSQDWLETLTEHRASWVICTAEALRAGEVLRQARDGGLDAVFVGGPDWQTELLAGAVGDAGREVWFVTGVPRVQDLREAQGPLARYRELPEHKPGPDAVWAYDATRVLLEALGKAIDRDGHATRRGTRGMLAQVSLEGATGSIWFDKSGARVGAPIWIYRTD